VLAAPAVAPLAFVRRPHQHRYQAWAPKLSRCIVLASWSAVQLWVMLEAQPRVKSYCERPAVAVIDGQERLIDFWVQLDNQEQWFVIQAEGEPILDLEVGGTQAPSVEGDCVQFVSPQSFEEHAVWIENWLSILPYLASTSRLVEPALVAQVVEPCRKATALWTIEQAHSRHDRMLVRTAVFMALHRGELLGMDLQQRQWDLDSEFVRPSPRRTGAT
jgi:hypothetical protein